MHVHVVCKKDSNNFPKKKKEKKRQTIEKEKKPSYIPAQYGVGCNIKTLLILKKKIGPFYRERESPLNDIF